MKIEDAVAVITGAANGIGKDFVRVVVLMPEPVRIADFPRHAGNSVYQSRR